MKSIVLVKIYDAISKIKILLCKIVIADKITATPFPINKLSKIYFTIYKVFSMCL